MHAREVVLGVSGITKRFGPLVANDRISLELHRGEVLGLLGENGAGKTTLMSILFGHYVADDGRIEVLGEPLPAGSPRAAIAAGIGMVHQHFTLAYNLSVLDNVILGSEPMWRLRSDRRRAAGRLRELSRRFGLEVDPDARIGELAVGERQRVEILKALYRSARILILDEPTAVLTPQESESLFRTLGQMAEQGLSIIFISHKLDEVIAACGRVMVLRAGRGDRRAGGHRNQRVATGRDDRRSRSPRDAARVRGLGRAGPRAPQRERGHRRPGPARGRRPHHPRAGDRRSRRGRGQRPGVARPGGGRLRRAGARSGAAVRRRRIALIRVPRQGRPGREDPRRSPRARDRFRHGALGERDPRHPQPAPFRPDGHRAPPGREGVRRGADRTLRHPLPGVPT